MPREWNGSVYPSEDRGTFSAKWKEWGTERWRVSKGFATRAAANDFLADKRREYRQRRRGDFDEFAEHRRRPIEDHVIEFHLHILGNRKRRSGKRSERHADQSRQRLRDAFAAMKVRTLADLTASRVDRHLAKLLDVDGLTVKTRNDYAAVLRQFSKWATADDRLERDPLGNVRFVENVAGPAKKQTLRWEDVRALAAACVQRQLQRAPRALLEQHLELGRRRGLAVVTMFLTGLRNTELANMRWEWIDCAAGVITVPHDVAKSARTEFVPLHAGLADLLRHERARRAAAAGRPIAGSDLVVGELWKGVPRLPHHINDRLRDDLRFLGGHVVDAAGRSFSIYALRGSFATQLTELGVPDGVVSELMRHRPSDVTRQHYVQRSLTMLRQAIDMIPRATADVPGLRQEPRQEPIHVRTGEDGCAKEGNARAQ